MLIDSDELIKRINTAKTDGGMPGVVIGIEIVEQLVNEMAEEKREHYRAIQTAQTQLFSSRRLTKEHNEDYQSWK